jgi:hypothetical protein
VYRCVEIAQGMLASGEIEAAVIAGVDLCGSIENLVFEMEFGPYSVRRQASHQLREDCGLVLQRRGG